MEHLKCLLQGAAGLLTALGPRPYPRDGGFAQDQSNLRGDWKRVGSDLRGSLKREAEQRRRVKSTDPR